MRSATMIFIGRALRSITFQSTHSMRSATLTAKRRLISRPISIHALHAECDSFVQYSLGSSNISIHALHAECDGDCHWH